MYLCSSYEFWTSGFFPGSLFLLLERHRKYTRIAPDTCSTLISQPHELQLSFACQWWSMILHQNAHRKDTHDLGFMIQPWARLAWDLHHDQRAYSSLVTAAYSLANRFDDTVGCIRSWDVCKTKRYTFTNPGQDFLVIIDNMLSKSPISNRSKNSVLTYHADLDLLFWVASQERDPSLAAKATRHARTTQSTHIRGDKSTFHVVNFDQNNGSIKHRFTNQGYSDSSCWSRGQAWGILGFAQTYLWTRDPSFLTTACELADYFMAHLPADGVPYWDFDAPIKSWAPRDTSAACITCYGLLLIHEAMAHNSPYLNAALYLLECLIEKSLAPPAHFKTYNSNPNSTESTLHVEMGTGEETILRNATINFYEYAPKRYADHGLVYADYYFLLVGNKLLQMGIAPPL
jgi:hypothetical protein